MSQQLGPHTHSPNHILKAAGAKFHSASNFSASLIKAYWRHPVVACLVWLMSEARNSSSYLLRWDDQDGQALVTERRAALCITVAAVRDTAHPHCSCQIKSTHVVIKLHSKALPCAFGAQGCVELSFPRRRRQLLQQGSLLPSGCAHFQALLRLR